MNVLIVKPGVAPYEAEINGSLKTMQEIVGGTIQAVYPYDESVALVCNDEGKLENLPFNRMLENYDYIAGTFFICGLSEDNFASLPPEFIEQFKKKFHHAEIPVTINGRLTVIKTEPQKQRKPHDRKKEEPSR